MEIPDNTDEERRKAQQFENRVTAGAVLVGLLLMVGIWFALQDIEQGTREWREKLPDNLTLEEFVPPVTPAPKASPPQTYPSQNAGESYYLSPPQIGSSHPAHNPYRDYNQPFVQAEGLVTHNVTRSDRMPDGQTIENHYARIEYTPKGGANGCYFHQFVGETSVPLHLQPGQYVTVEYQKDVPDWCGSSGIKPAD